MKIKARIDECNGVRCGNCGHKLMRIVGIDGSCQSPTLEIKCHSCKTLNMWWYDGRKKNDE